MFLEDFFIKENGFSVSRFMVFFQEPQNSSVLIHDERKITCKHGLSKKLQASVQM